MPGEGEHAEAEEHLRNAVEMAEETDYYFACGPGRSSRGGAGAGRQEAGGRRFASGRLGDFPRERVTSPARRSALRELLESMARSSA